MQTDKTLNNFALI